MSIEHQNPISNLPSPPADNEVKENRDPGDDDSGEGTRPESPKEKSEIRRSLPTVEELMLKLLDLNGALLIGAVSEKKANVIHKNIKAVLDAQQKRAANPESTFDEEELREQCRKNPAILNSISSLLTPEQLASLMKDL